MWPEQFLRLLAPILAAVEERSERFSLRAGSDASDLVAGRGGYDFVGNASGEPRPIVGAT